MNLSIPLYIRIVKEITFIKNKSILLSVIGLALLLLLSPCKVRNHLQAQLGVTQTDVVNKNKTTLPNTTCNLSEVVESTIQSAIPTFHFLSSLAKNNTQSSSYERVVVELLQNPNNQVKSTSFLAPLYILYQNFKAYL